MKVTLALTLDKDAQSKANAIDTFFSELNEFIQHRNYGHAILELLIVLQVVNPPKGFEHLFKVIKPKYIEYKLLTNRLTGEPMVLEKQFSYSVKIVGEEFKTLICATDEQLRKLLAQEIMKSLKYLDALPKKVKDFQKDRFRSDLELFFETRV